jgi:DNA polymerase-1
MIDPVLLFDTSSFIFRAYYSNPPIHRGRDGMPIGAVMGFCSMLNKLLLTSMLRGETPILVHCLDAPGKTFRNDLYEDYKAHRPPVPLDLVPQFDLINRAARAYGMIQIQATGFEADDVIATLATIGSKEEGLDVKILSGDKDLMQLISQEEDEDSIAGRVHMIDPMSSKEWTHDGVVEKWGVLPSQLGDVLALAGDAADNVPGVPGIGPKIAAQLLQEFGTLESLLENTDKIPQPKRREKLESNADSARISRELVDLQRSLEWSQMEAFHPPPPGDFGDITPTPTPIPESTKIGDLRMQPIQPDRILAFYEDMGFNKLRTQFLDRLARVQPRETMSEGTFETEHDPPENNSPESESVAAAAAATLKEHAKPKAAPKAKAKPKSSFKRNFWEKKKRGVPKPEEFKDVPF